MTTGKWITLTDFCLALIGSYDWHQLMTHLQSYHTARREEIARTSVFLWEASTWGTGLNHHNGNFSTNMLLRLWLEDRHFAYRYSWSGEYSVDKWSNSLRATAKCSKNAGCVYTKCLVLKCRRHLPATYRPRRSASFIRIYEKSQAFHTAKP